MVPGRWGTNAGGDGVTRYGEGFGRKTGSIEGTTRVETYSLNPEINFTERTSFVGVSDGRDRGEHLDLLH